VKVLVTGGAGYIGSHAVRAVLEAGHGVVVLDDLSRGHAQAVPQGVSLVVGDLADSASRALSGVDVVMHFAGRASVRESVSDPASYYDTNVAKGLALLAAMGQHGVRRLVFSSTCAVYGTPVQLPLEEGHPREPINPYGNSKRAFEVALSDFARAGLLRAVALRYFNAAGCSSDGSLGEDHRPEEHLIPLALDAALGRGPSLTLHGVDYDTPDGTCIRDYIHVDDLARAHVIALDVLDRGEPFKAYNLGTEIGHSVREVIGTVERVTHQPVPVVVGPRRPGDPARLVASSAKARQELGFRPEQTLETAVESAFRWRMRCPEGYVGVP